MLIKLQSVSDDIVLTLDGQTIYKLLPVIRQPSGAPVLQLNLSVNDQNYHGKLHSKLRRGK